MKIKIGFFVKYGDTLYSEPFELLSEARKDAKIKSLNKKLKIYHGKLKIINDQIIDDSELSLVPRINGYGDKS